MAGDQTQPRIVEPIYEIHGCKGQCYLVGRYALFWMEQRFTGVALKWSQKSIKFIFLFFNSLSMISAVTVFILSLKRDEYDMVMAGVSLQNNTHAAQNQDALTLITLLSIIVTCLYGYWFLLKENRTQSVNFIVLCSINLIFNMVLLMVQLLGTAILYIGLSNYPAQVQPPKRSFEVPHYWNELQENARCCGYNGPQDWKTFLPQSCCPKLKSMDYSKRVLTLNLPSFPNKPQIHSCTREHAFKRGCKFVFYKKVFWPAIIFLNILIEMISFLAAYFYYFAIKVTRGYETYPISLTNADPS